MRLRYFFWFVLAFLSGILSAAMGWKMLIIVSLVVLFLCGLLFPSYRKVLLMALLGVVVGFFIFSLQQGNYLQTISALDGQTVQATGRVEDVREEDGRLLLYGELAGQSFRYEKIRFHLYPKEKTTYSYGDILSFEGKAHTPEGPENFGESDYRLYCMGQGLYASFYLQKEEITLSGYSLSLFRPKDFAHILRTRAQTALSGRVSPETEGFLRAFLTGDKSLLFAESSLDLQHSGLSHIVAVSGLHLQIVCGAMMALFGILKIRRRLFSNIVYLLFVWFFVLFTGASPSVLRAALMLSVFFFADFFRRENDSLTALAFSAFSLCIANPAILFNISFQLSYASTLGILLFAKSFSTLLSFLPRIIRTSLSVSLSTMVGFAPLAAYHFGTVSMVGILANLLVCPLLAPIMVTGLCALMVADIPHVSSLLFFCLDKIVGYILWVARFLGNLPIAGLSLARPEPTGFLLYLSFVLAFLVRKKHRLILLCFALLLSAVLSIQTFYLERAVTVTFLSVGNSECVLVEADGNTLLFDSGGNTDENTVISYLNREGISKIDAAFLTHYSKDHGEGYLALMEDGYVGRLFLPSYKDKTLKPALLSTAIEHGVPVRHLRDGDRVSLASLDLFALDGRCGEGDNGLVYRIDVPGGNILLTGDLDRNGQRYILYRGGNVDCDILTVPSHGTDGGYLPEFIEAAQPSVAVISSDQPPDESILQGYEAQNISLFRTDRDGAIRIRIFPDGRRIIKTFR